MSTLPETLRAQLAEATGGPWRFASDERNERGGDDDERFVGTIKGRDAGGEWHLASVESDGPRPLADATLIASAVNALPKLLDVVEKAGDLERKLRAVGIVGGEGRGEAARDAHFALQDALAALNAPAKEGP